MSIADRLTPDQEEKATALLIEHAKRLRYAFICIAPPGSPFGPILVAHSFDLALRVKSSWGDGTRIVRATEALAADALNSALTPLYQLADALMVEQGSNPSFHRMNGQFLNARLAQIAAEEGEVYEDAPAFAAVVLAARRVLQEAPEAQRSEAMKTLDDELQAFAGYLEERAKATLHTAKGAMDGAQPAQLTPKKDHSGADLALRPVLGRPMIKCPRCQRVTFADGTCSECPPLDVKA
jgi:hypothetical protein